MPCFHNELYQKQEITDMLIKINVIHIGSLGIFSSDILGQIYSFIELLRIFSLILKISSQNVTVYLAEMFTNKSGIVSE